MDEKAVRSLLERLAETEQPPARVDVELVRQEGRKKLRWRLLGLIGASVITGAVAVGVIAGSVVTFGPGSRGAGSTSPAGQASVSPGISSPSPTVATGPPSPSRFEGAGHKYLRPGFVSQTVASSSPSKLIVQAPPGVVRWSLDSVSCGVNYKVIRKTAWGNPGEGGGGGGAACPWAPHLSLGAGVNFYSRGVLFSVTGGKVLPPTGVRIRVTLADGAQMTVRPHHAMWLVIVQRCGAYKRTAIRSVELLGPRGSLIARKVLKPGISSLTQSGRSPC